MAKKTNGKISRKKKKIILISLIVIIIIAIIFLLYMLLFKGSNNSADRCSTDEYNISNTTLNKAKKSLESLEQVKSVKIFKNVCILKIIINLNEDISIDELKAQMSKVLEDLGTDVTGEFDISLFVTSENKESEIYPLNVTKHKSREDFAW